MATKATKSPVSTRALIQRINRKLADAGEQLKTNRSERWWNDLGSYYTVDLRHNAIRDKHVNLEEYGRELGALRDYEALKD